MTAVALVFYGSGLLLFCGAAVLWDWQFTDRDRRHERMVHRNLQRIGGQS